MGSSRFKKMRKRIDHDLKDKEEVVVVSPKFTKEDAVLIAKALKIDFAKEKFDIEEFFKGVNVELEHGSKFPETNVTKNDPILTGKIAYAHLKEFPDYYERLSQLEKEANEYWNPMKNQ